jgi:MFS family permease
MGSTEPDKPTSDSVTRELEQFLPSDHKAWYKKGHLIRLNLIASSLVLFSSSNGYDGSLMNGLQALEQWNGFMNNPAGAWLGWLNGIYWVGCFIGYPCGAFIGNKWGRKPAVYIGYALLILGVALQTAAPTDIAFMMARLFLGGASAFFGATTPLLLNEIAYPTQRGTWNALFMSGWYVGGSVAGWVTFATRTYSSSWAWRLPSLLQALVPLLALPGFLLSEESPRWLISVGRKEEAREILAKYHAGGDISSPLVNYEMIEISSAIEAEQEAHNSSSYLEMIKTPGNRRRLFCSITLGIFAQWSGNGVISYYLALILDSVGVKSVEDQTLISACLQMWNLIFSVIAGFLADRLGRRPLFMLSAVIMFVSYILVTGLSGAFDSSGNSGVGAAVIPFLFIFFAGYDIAL